MYGKITLCFFNVSNFVYAKAIPEINAFLSPNQYLLACSFKKNFKNGNYEYTF